MEPVFILEVWAGSQTSRKQPSSVPARLWHCSWEATGTSGAVTIRFSQMGSVTPLVCGHISCLPGKGRWQFFCYKDTRHEMYWAGHMTFPVLQLFCSGRSLLLLVVGIPSQCAGQNEKGWYVLRTLFADSCSSDKILCPGTGSVDPHVSFLTSGGHRAPKGPDSQGQAIQFSSWLW